MKERNFLPAFMYFNARRSIYLTQQFVLKSHLNLYANHVTEELCFLFTQSARSYTDELIIHDSLLSALYKYSCCYV
jgi:hypothetical protein